MRDPLQIVNVPMGEITHQSGIPQVSDDNFTNTNKGPQTKRFSQGEDLKQLLIRLYTKHDLYNKYESFWRFYLDAYEGGQAMLSGEKDYLFKHQREADEDFADRKLRAHYTNYCEPLTTFFTDFIFTETIQRDGGTKADWFNDFLGDVNKKGDDVTTFMSEICDDFQIFGTMYALVDTPPKPEGVTQMTKADEKQFKISPYWVSVTPLEVYDWAVDEFDNFLYWKRYQKAFDVDVNGNKTPIERFTEWTPTQITVTEVETDKNGQQSATQTLHPNTLQKVPVVKLIFRRSKEDPEIGNAFLRDLANDNRTVLNLDSLLDEFLYRQCFNIMALEMDGELPKADQEDGASGTSNMIIYPKGAKAPQYIAPQATPADKIREARQGIVAEMYRRAAQDTVNELFNGGGSSGFSKAQSFRTTVPRIATRAEALEKFEIKMFRLTYEYMNAKWDGKIAYKDHYEITNLADALSQMETLFSKLLIPSQTFAKEEMHRMVQLFDGKISPDKLKAIHDEIESADWTEWQDTMKLNFLGRAATSPDVGTVLGQPPAPVPGTSSAMATPGKDTPTAPSTAKKPTLNNAQAAKTSAK